MTVQNALEEMKERAFAPAFQIHRQQDLDWKSAGRTQNTGRR